MSAFKVVRDFEQALCEYTGAPFAVTTTSCTTALTLAVAWCIAEARRTGRWTPPMPPNIEIPKRTYVGVPYAIRDAGGEPTFRDEEWRGFYDLRPLHVFDSARFFTSGMWGFPVQGVDRPITPNRGYMICVSFHWSKTLGIQQGGAILHDDPVADQWLRRARFDGRMEGVPPSMDEFPLRRAWHCYMSPETAAAGLVRLARLPKHNEPLPNDNYPDLSQLEAFR